MLFSVRVKTLAIAAVLACAARSSAAVITFEGHGLSRNVTIFHEVAPNRSEIAGQMNLTVNGVPFVGYCVDLDNDAPNNWQADLLPVNVINNGIAIAYLFDTWASTVDTTLEAAGLQIAIWEVLDDYDTTLDLTANDFRQLGASGSDNAVRAQAQSYLASLPTPAVLAGYVPQSIIVFSSAVDQAQHMIIPEPASLSMLAVGTMLVLRRSRR